MKNNTGARPALQTQSHNNHNNNDDNNKQSMSLLFLYIKGKF